MYKRQPYYRAYETKDKKQRVFILNKTCIEKLTDKNTEILYEKGMVQHGRSLPLVNIEEEYTIDNYYKEDELGRSVLEMKYLAPGEKNPWELWKRQAKALASVEKTPELQDKWEAAFFDALKNFKFVPGGRIMHGAGREDITTTLNNCYVVGIKDDSIKSIYDLSLIHI